MSEEQKTEIKFTDDEMKSLAQVQSKYQNNMIEFGQLQVTKYNIEAEIARLKESEEKLRQTYSNIQQEERELLDSLNKKYGEGSLDPSTGIFTPLK